jgi:hypothetical protein
MLNEKVLVSQERRQQIVFSFFSHEVIIILWCSEKAFVDPSLSEKVMVKVEVEKARRRAGARRRSFRSTMQIHDLCRQVKSEGLLTHALR